MSSTAVLSKKPIKMSPISSKKLIQILKRMGATVSQTKGSHQQVILNGSSAIIPIHSTDIKYGTFIRIIKALNLKQISSKEFVPIT